MTTKTKQILSTVAAVVGAVALVAGIIMDVPDAIDRLRDRAPQFLQNPNLWWVIGVSAVTAIIIWLIWRNPVDGLSEELDDMIQKSSGYESTKILLLMRSLNSLADNHTKMTNDELLHNLEIILPPEIEHYLNKEEANRFLSVVRAARKKSGGSSIIALKAGGKHLLRVLSDETQKQRDAVKQRLR